MFLLLYFQTELRGMSSEAGAACTSMFTGPDVAISPLLSVMMACSKYSPGRAFCQATENGLELAVPTTVPLVKTWIKVMFVPPEVAVPEIDTVELAIVCPLVGLLIVIDGSGLATRSISKLMSEL